MSRASGQKQVNHRPNRDFDVVLDHNRIAYELERNKNLEKDLLLAFFTPEAGPQPLHHNGYTAMPPAYDMNVLAIDALDEFINDYFHEYSPTRNSSVGSAVEEDLSAKLAGSGLQSSDVQVSRVTPDLWEQFLSTGTFNHSSRSDASTSGSEKVEEIILLEPHELTDGVGVKMYLDFHAKKKKLLKNKRATKILKACGIRDRRVFGPAVVMRYKVDSQGSTEPLDCGLFNLPDVDKHAAKGRHVWEGMWMSVAAMQRNGRGALSARELSDVKLMEQVVACKTKGNELYKQRHYRRAIEEYSKGLTIHPHCTPLLLNKALMHMKLEEYEFAISDLMLVVKLQPGNEKTIYRTAQCMRRQGNPKSSIEFMLMFFNDHRSAAMYQLLKDTYESIK